MTNGHLGGIVRHLKSLLGAQDARTATDGELLKRFAQQHDEAAFAALVERYAPLVSGVCRRTLQNDHDAEDVFQATFLVLLRKAGSLDGRGTVANWLYTVAYHLALKARARTGQRRAHERQVADMPEVETPTEPLWQELRPLLDEELDRLPAKYRSPMVLCYLTGKTNEQAAQELGWTKDTVRGRLAKGRELLRNRLARRGITLTAATLAAVLTEHARLAAVPAGWINATLQAGTLFAAGQTAAGGISASVLALVQVGLKEVFFAKLKVAAALCLVVGIAGTGVGLTALEKGRDRQEASQPLPDGRGSLLSNHRNGVPSAPKFEPYEVDPVTACPEEEMMEEEMAELPPEPPPPPKVTIKRRDWACEGELQKQLLAVPEVNVGSDLPRREDGAARLAEQSAKDLITFSRELRRLIAELQGDRRVTRDKAVEPHLLAAALQKNLADRTRTLDNDFPSPIFGNPGAVATLMQMLTAEESGIRMALTERLTGFSHPAATEALARLALFDLAPEVRAAAVQALAGRPRADYRAILLGGFRYPWAPVADHAAEALVALEDRDAVPALKVLAAETEPPVVREVVRINHLRGCLMCHAPSTRTDDLVRGRIPVPGEKLPPLSEYYQREDGDFVRADITYLRQDFSVTQPVVKAKNDPWPDRQRYDYLVRTRPMTDEEMSKPRLTSPQREAILYTLRELSAK